MKRWSICSLLIAILTASLVSGVFAAPWKDWQGSGGWGVDSAYQLMYDPAEVVTMSGVVVSINDFTPLKEMHKGVRLKIQNEWGTLSVHLGPTWYIERLDEQITTGDEITVTGSRITFEDETTLIAAEVKKKDAVLLLRNDRGVPVWCGWQKTSSDQQ